MGCGGDWGVVEGIRNWMLSSVVGVLKFWCEVRLDRERLVEINCAGLCGSC